MSLPTPKNVRFNDERGIDFEVEIEGRMWKATITVEAVEKLYSAQPDLLCAVSQSSEITRLVAKRIKAGDEELVVLNSMMVP